MKLNRDRLRLEIRRARGPFLMVAGALTVALIVALGLTRNLKVQKPWESTYTTLAAFDDAKGVSPGKTPVRLAGVEIGLVKDVVVRDRQAVLTLSILKSNGPIYRDARLRLRPITPLDDLYVQVESRGTPSAGRLHGDQVLHAANTTSPVDISRVLQVFNTPTRESMATLIDELGRSLPDGGKQLHMSLAQFGPFFESLRVLTKVTSDRRDLVRRLVRNTSLISQELGDRDKRVAQLVTTGDQVLTELARREAPFARTLAELPPTIGALSQATGSLDEARQHVDPALRALVPPAQNLKAALTAVTRVSEAGLPAVRALAPPVRQLTPLAADLPATTRDLSDTVRVLRGQTTSLDRSTAKLPPCFDSLQQFFSHTMSLAKFYDAYRVVARATAGEGQFAVGTAVSEAGWKKLRPCSKAQAPAGGP